jgi:hypothetical protein
MMQRLSRQIPDVITPKSPLPFLVIDRRDASSPPPGQVRSSCLAGMLPDGLDW